MKILIFGASGSGTTTLGNEIEKRTNFVHLDVDDYYWKKTQPPFQEKIPLTKRNKNLKVDFKKFENVIICGSMVSWGKEWETSFDLAIFLYLNNSKRIERLEKRETERYGEKLLTDKKIKQNSKAFLEWAKQYENPNFNGRSLKIHNDWIELLTCEVLRINGEMELNNKVEKVITKIKSNINIKHMS
ncbi:AAA family ATPase [uncultured Aquimarina sp.]|uniref:AAA family ATPase n=1 Tax=uncultured Aquimarina sp. TaxID=575652 RepID=UPI00261E75B1|nr:AAA family ATPase [uncultured Aquimarina sp.]